MKKIIFSLLVFASIDCWSSADKEAIKKAEQSQLTIDADGGVICDKEKLTCTAKDNVFVEKGPFQMYCDTLTTHIRKNSEGKMEMWRIVAVGNVRMIGAEKSQKAFAPMADYNMDESKIVLLAEEGILPVVTKDQYILEAKKIEVLVKKEGDKQSIDKMQAYENVVLSSPDEIAKGDFATYNPETNIAVMQGAVTIYRKDGKISGSEATVDLNAETSEMVNNSKDETGKPKRVHALILPKNMNNSKKVAE